MGANCCVAAREKPQLSGNLPDVSMTLRNARRSPSWSFRWDNRTHIEDMMENLGQFSSNSSGNIQPEIKINLSAAATQGPSNDACSSNTSGTLHKVGSYKMEADGALDTALGKSTPTNCFPKEAYPGKLLDVHLGSCDRNSPFSFSLPSSPPVLFRAESSFETHVLSPELISSWEAHRSPGYQLDCQVSDSKVPSFRSWNEHSSPDGQVSSPMLSVGSYDLSAGGSYGGSSDGWSMRAFSELVASSQKERWSLDSERSCSIQSNQTRYSALHAPTSSPSWQVCKICSKILKERMTRRSQELAVLSVLVCGHVYHADCLDSLTEEADKYDPPCPVCTSMEKSKSKSIPSRKTQSKLHQLKFSKNNSDGDLEGSSGSKRKPQGGKSPSLVSSSSMKSPLIRAPFLKRHFSIGAQPSGSVSDIESRRKGFWARHW